MNPQLLGIPEAVLLRSIWVGLKISENGVCPQYILIIYHLYPYIINIWHTYGHAMGHMMMNHDKP